MKELILVGNPNTGKSAIFNTLTGAHTHTGNRHGVTVSAYSKRCTIKGEDYLLTDLPGCYSFEKYTMEEEVTANYIRSHTEGYYLLIVDARRLRSSTAFLEEFSRLKRKSAVILTMYKQFQRSGGKINLTLLQKKFGVPFEVLDSYDKKSVLDWKNNFDLKNFRLLNQNVLSVSFVEYDYFAKESCLERFVYNRFFALPLFLAMVVFTFFLTFHEYGIGALLKSVLEELLCDQFVNYVSGVMHTDWLYSLVVDGIIRPLGGVLSFLPQLAVLYALLQFMDESGFMNAIAFSMDGILSKIGWSGRTVFCVLLGYGCTAQAILSSRNGESKSEQKRLIYALSMIPCAAKMPVYLLIVSSFFKDPFPFILLLYAFATLSAFLYITFFAKEKKGDFILEIPELSLPNVKVFINNLLFQLKGFIMKVASVVFVFSVIVWALSSFDWKLQFVAVDQSILASVCGILKYFLYPIGIFDWQMAFTLLSGLIAKENIAGCLQMFYPNGLSLSLPSAIACCVFILFCAPCISAISATAKELGVKTALQYTFTQLIVALLLSYAVCSVWALYFVLFILISMGLKRFCIEKFYRYRRNNVKKVYR